MRLYLSYRRTDRSFVGLITIALEKLGQQVWWDGMLAPGEAFERQIADRLEDADVFVAFLSKYSATGVQQPQEVALAKAQGRKRILAVKLDAFDVVTLPFDLPEAYWLDLVGETDPDVAAHKIVEAIGRAADIAQYATLDHDIPSLAGKIKLIAKAAREEAAPEPASEVHGDNALKKIFVVHGHDEAMMDDVSAFLRGEGIEPIILKQIETPQNTLFEKFNAIGRECPFAIALISGDDFGASILDYDAKPSQALQYRARQNVILEIGFFFGKLGWENVFTLVKKPRERVPYFEWPSDLGGVMTTDYDANGGWKAKLLKKLRDRASVI